MTDHSDGKMGIWMTSALVVGTIIGSGIFMLPVSLAPLGRNALIGWVISGIGVLCIVYGLARLSRLSGDGIQANVEREFGPTMGFLVAWSFWVSNWVAQASVAIGAASALSFAGVDFGGQTGVLLFANTGGPPAGSVTTDPFQIMFVGRLRDSFVGPRPVRFVLEGMAAGMFRCETTTEAGVEPPVFFISAGGLPAASMC